MKTTIRLLLINLLFISSLFAQDNDYIKLRGNKKIKNIRVHEIFETYTSYEKHGSLHDVNNTKIEYLTKDGKLVKFNKDGSVHENKKIKVKEEVIENQNDSLGTPTSETVEIQDEVQISKLEEVGIKIETRDNQGILYSTLHTIYLKNGEVILVDLMSITEKEVVYKIANNTEENSYIRECSSIDKILNNKGEEVFKTYFSNETTIQSTSSSTATTINDDKALRKIRISGLNYYLGNEKISHAEVGRLILEQGNSEAIEMWQNHRNNRAGQLLIGFGSALGALQGGLVGVSIGLIISGDGSETGYIGAIAGFCIAQIASFNHKFRHENQQKKAVEIYNKELLTSI